MSEETVHVAWCSDARAWLNTSPGWQVIEVPKDLYERYWDALESADDLAKQIEGYRE